MVCVQSAAVFHLDGNEKFRAVVADKIGGLAGTYITPKQAGTNEYAGYHCVI
jgi:hypothetical protein